MAKLSEIKRKDGAKPAVVATGSPVVENQKEKTRERSKNVKKEKDAGDKQRVWKRRLLPKIKGSGLIFIKHLPKGFDEDGMRQFFKQFGDIVRVCVARSKTTQQSKGYGYVHFRFHEVAEIAASAVNNYMMFGRVLKAVALPKKMTKVPRNFGRAFNSKGEQTGAYRKWLQKRVREQNSYLGEQTLCDRVSKRLKLLKRAEKLLSETGIELPEMEINMLKLKAKRSDLQKQIKEKLDKKAELDKAKESAVEQVMDNNDDDDDDEDDEEDAFNLLEPSDWQNVKIIRTRGEAKDTKEEAVKKAQEKKEEFELAHKKTDNPIANKNKENKKVATVKKQPKTAKQLVTAASDEEPSKASPVKKQPKKANPSLSKKKGTEKTVVPSLKLKAKPAAKKTVKLGKKVK
uniref:RRM domain-containing protein n=1 Tax=Anopheles minimus TaxID=112268 RepID=A0A182WHS9_9DIPT